MAETRNCEPSQEFCWLPRLRDTADVRKRHGSDSETVEDLKVSAARITELIEENRRLRDEIDELRREGRYVAELYDVVVERVRTDSTER